MRATAPRVLLALLLASAAARAGRGPTDVMRLPLQSDFDRCALLAADHGNENLQGRVRLELLLRSSGNVYAAFVHSAAGIDDKRLFACLTGFALLWKLPPVAVDYQRPYELAFVPGGTEIDMSPLQYQAGIHYAGQGRASVFMPGIDDPAPSRPPDVALAQRTLDVAEWAEESERGIAELVVGRTPQALSSLRAALERDPSDPIALRGLATALAGTGEVGEARAAADLLAAVRPGSVVAAEAMLRVCIAAGDDPCTFRSFNAASHAGDLGPRSRLVAELQPRAEQAAARLREQAAVARKNDPCAALADSKALATCLVRKCLDDGLAAWAAERKMDPGAWTISPAGEEKFVATRAMGSGASDPRWVVVLGTRSVKMSPVNEAARQVSVRHSRCGIADPSVLLKNKTGAIEQPFVRAGAAKSGQQ